MAREPAEVASRRQALGRQLASRRAAAGLTQNDVAQALHYERSSVSHIEAGRQGAPRPFWQQVDRLLGAQGALVAGYDDVVHAKAHRHRHTAGVGAAIDAVVGILDPTARQAGESVGDARQAALRWLVSSDLALTSGMSGPRRVGRSDVDRLDARREQFKALDNRAGGAAVLPLLTTYLRREVLPLLHGQYVEITGRNLMGVTAQLVLDAGWAAYDANAQPFARRCMLTALRLAEAADDRLFGGRVLAALAHQALHLGRKREGLELASAAVLGAGRNAGPRAVAMFEAMVACAAASLGETARCESALSRADKALGRITGDADTPRWLDFDGGGLAGHAARAYRDLGRTDQARRSAEEAIELCRASHARTRVQRQAILATALVYAGDIEHACAVGHNLLVQSGQVRSGLVMSDVQHLARLMPHTAAGTEFRARAHSLLIASHHQSANG